MSIAKLLRRIYAVAATPARLITVAYAAAGISLNTTKRKPNNLLGAYLVYCVSNTKHYYSEMP